MADSGMPSGILCDSGGIDETWPRILSQAYSPGYHHMDERREGGNLKDF
ncbi:MAG: hypothetical protein ACLR0U_25315 [Enterocloster clostridioformis]